MGRPKKPDPPWSPTHEDWSPPGQSYPRYVDNPRWLFCRNFRKLFAEYKKKTGRGVSTIAKAISAQKRDIYRFLSGERVPSLDTMQELAIVLGVKIEDFFREDL